MPIAGIAQGFGIGGGTSATISGFPAGGDTPFANDWSCAFDGTSDYMNCGDIDDMGDIDALSFSAWIYPEADGKVVVSGNGDVDDGFFFQTAFSKLYFGVGVGGSASYITVGGVGIGNGIATGAWSHVCCVWDKTMGSPQYGALYVHGVSHAFTLNNLPSGATKNDADAFDNFRIGRYTTGIPYWNGKIDEVALWDSALTAQQVMNIAKGGASGDSKESGDTNAAGDLSTFEPAHWWRMGDTGSDAAGGDGAAVSLITDAGDTGGSNAVQPTGTAQPALSTSAP